MIDDGCAFQNRVERLGHYGLLGLGWDLRAFPMGIT
jgi:hypothetical protein